MTSRKFIVLIFFVAAVVIAGAAATSLLVVHVADEIVGSQAYCIQISDGESDYRPARSWLDLSILRMRAKRDGSLYMQHHAVLVVGEASAQQLYHWSYRNRVFEPGVLNGTIKGSGPAIACQPMPDFAAKQLALIFPASFDSDYIRYSDGDIYRIPRERQAKWSGGRNPILSLATAAPDFRPLNRRWSDLTWEERDSNRIFIEWNPEWLLNVMKAPPGGNIVEQSTELGLSKSKTITYGRDRKEYIGSRYLAYADGHGINTTMIDCGTPSEAIPKSCQHRFINRGRHFNFRHRPEDVPQWQKMQQSILGVIDSFEEHERP